jgi:HPt (histidine-containing phosphotransfer) domain-containing protein
MPGLAMSDTDRWFDEQHALAATGDDPIILGEIVQLFLDDLPRRLNALHCALAEGNLESIASVAHSLRGSASIFGSDATAQAALWLEKLARRGSTDAIPSAMASVEFHLGKLVEALRDFLRRYDPNKQ